MNFKNQQHLTLQIEKFQSGYYYLMEEGKNKNCPGIKPQDNI